MVADIFGEVRSLLQRPPSPELWGRLCKLLDVTSQQEGLRAYLIDHLLRWPDTLRVAPSDWCAQALAGETPRWWSLVRSVRLLQPTNATLKALLRTGDIAHITSLTLEDQPPVDEYGRSKSGLLQELAKAGPLPHLKRLELRQGNFGDRGAMFLANATNLSGLELLELSEVQFEDEGYLALASSQTLPPLKSLVLQDPLSKKAQLAWIESPLCRQLERLHLMGYLEPAALRALAQAPCASTLRELRVLTTVSENPEPALRAFVSSPIVEQLEVLDSWDDMFLRGEFGEALMSSPFPQNVVKLHVETAALSDEDLRRTFTTPMPRLRSLHFRQSTRSRDALRLLRDNPCLATVEELHLNVHAASEQDYVDVLGQTQALRSLELTCHHDEKLTDDALARAFEAANLTHLRRLKLTSHVLQGPGLEALRHTPNLRHLILTESSLGDPEAMATLATHAPKTLEVLELQGSRRVQAPGIAGTMCDFVSSVWPSLSDLRLSRRDITDADFDAMMHAADALPALRLLDVLSSHITNECLQAQMHAHTEGTLTLPRALQWVLVSGPDRDVVQAWGAQLRVEV